MRQIFIICLEFVIWSQILIQNSQCDPINPKIIGGEPVAPNSIPYQVAILVSETNFHCNGVILNENYVLTTATCAREIGVTVLAGEHRLSIDEGTEQFVDVIEVINHPGFNTWTLTNNLSLLKLQTPLVFNDVVKAVPRFSSLGESFEGLATVSGWGSTTEKNETGTSDLLRKATVQLVSDTVCRDYYGREKIADSMMCTIPLEGQDPCYNDNGGPLMCTVGSSDEQSQQVLCGLISHGNGCGWPNIPSVYTQLSYYETWIKEMIRL